MAMAKVNNQITVECPCCGHVHQYRVMIGESKSFRINCEHCNAILAKVDYTLATHSSTKVSPVHTCSNCKWARKKAKDVYKNGTKLFCSNRGGPKYYLDVDEIENCENWG